MVGVGTQNALLHTGDQKFVNLIGEYSYVPLRNAYICIQIKAAQLSLLKMNDILSHQRYLD